MQNDAQHWAARLEAALVHGFKLPAMRYKHILEIAALMQGLAGLI